MNTRPLCGLLFPLVLVASVARGAEPPSRVYTHFAGSTGGSRYEDGDRTTARLSIPQSVVRDGQGNLYVAEGKDHTIRRIAPDGTVTTFAGRRGVPGSTDGPGWAARFKWPAGLAFDRLGNLFVADSGNQTIRRITPDGNVTTFGGKVGVPGDSGSDLGTALFSYPSDLEFDRGGNLWVLGDNLRRVTPEGVVTTPGRTEDFEIPVGFAVDAEGNALVADAVEQVIKKVTPAREISILAGTWFRAGSGDGIGVSASFRSPADVAIGADGSIFVADSENHTLRKILPDRRVLTISGRAGVAGSRDGDLAQATFNLPYSLTLEPSGDLLVVDRANGSIRRVTVAGMVTTVAGQPAIPTSSDPAAPEFRYPTDPAFDSMGNLYVLSESSAILKITPAGEVSTLAGRVGERGTVDGRGLEARLTAAALTIDRQDRIWMTGFDHTVRRVSLEGVVTTVAGLAGDCAYADGIATTARFCFPAGIAVDSAGSVFVSEANSRTIRKISPDGTVTTFAGRNGRRGSEDGTGTAALFEQPGPLAVDGADNLYVGDAGNATIRKVTPAAVVTTLAGLARQTGTTDGQGSSARFKIIRGLALAPEGDLYVADDRTIRRVTGGGMVTTVAGSAGDEGNVDGVDTAARFVLPSGVAFDARGNLHVTDYWAHNVRVGRPAIADRATIDASTAKAGELRRLGTHPSSATSWLWRLTVVPSGSRDVTLSSAIAADPTFTPDAPGYYEFTLTAVGPAGASISRIGIDVASAEELAAPRVTATATSDGRVTVGWTRVDGAEGYEVLRRSGTEPLQFVATTALNGYDDFGTLPNRAYVYHVRAFGGRLYSRLSAPDIATTVRFTDDPLLTGTVVKAAHFLELRTAIEALRETAGLSPFPYFSPLTPRLVIRQSHLRELREAQGPARSALGLSPVPFTDPVVTSTIRLLIKRDHILELRDAVR